MKKQIQLAIMLAAGTVVPLSSQAAGELIAGWDFERLEADGTSIKSIINDYTGVVSGAAILTDAGGGRPTGGGKGFDVSQANPGWLQFDELDVNQDNNPLDKAAANDQMTVVLWEKNNSNINSSSFWSTGEGFNRAFQFHVPWSDGTIYFDTAGGCCAVPTQRLNMNVVNTFPEHDWLAWHHYAFVKDVGRKAVYVDGELLVEQEDGAAPLPTAFNRMSIGAADNATPPDAVIDDFGIYKGALTQAEIKDVMANGFVKPTDTDGDGMPDNWETEHGFNPNSAADATLDCDGDGVNNLAEYTAGTDPCDKTAPVLAAAAVSTATFDRITLNFNEKLDPTTATNVANYSITPALNITGATLSKNSVILTTAAQAPGGTNYTVTVNNVQDISKNVVAANSKATFYSYLQVKQGALRYAEWRDITGTPVQNLYDDPRYPATPDMVAAVFSVNSRDVHPNDSLENYGAIIEGLITPTENGDYDFFLRSDDASELYISTDATPTNLQLVAQETGCCDAYHETGTGAEETTATPITMVANKPYFIRAVYKEGGGGDYVQVAWRKTTDTKPAAGLTPIPGQFLSSTVDVPAPAEGAFISQTPGVNQKNVLPNSAITIVHRDGKTAWTDANVTLKVDDQTVTPTVTKAGNVATISVQPSAQFASGSVHKVTLGYQDPGGNPATNEWSFTTLAYRGPTRDKVAGYPGLIAGSAVFTPNNGGHSGSAGDYAMDLTSKGGPVLVADSTFLSAVNTANAADEMTIAFWSKHRDIADSSAFVMQSPSSSSQRSFHGHVPWSDGHIYFDTAGCCDLATQRIEAGIDTLPGYTGADAVDLSWWTNGWKFYTFTKKGSTKNIYVNGQPFLTGDSTSKLPTDVNVFYMGADGGGGGLYHATVDDFSVYSKELAPADVTALFGGTLPTALPAGKGLLGYWDFNDVAPVGGGISIVKDGTNVKITYTGTLQSSDTLGGAWTPVSGATSPYSTAPSGGQKYYKAQ